MTTAQKTLDVGDKVPDLTLLDDQGSPVRLRDLEGKRVVLYFYPKDNTSGCTTQACGLRDNWSVFEGHDDLVVYGVSPDSVESHAKWRTKLGLPFHLLVDDEKELMGAFGFWGEKSMYGKKYMGVIRSTVLLDEKGVVTHVFRNVKPADHVQLLQDTLGL
jgi:peroxiredoxin Q/BCP